MDSDVKIPISKPFFILYFALLARLSLFHFLLHERVRIIVYTSEGFHED